MEKFKNFIKSRRLWRILSLTAAILSGAKLAFLGGLYLLAATVGGHAQNNSVGVIGGADGPTMIIVSTTGSPWLEILLPAAVCAVSVFAYMRLRKRK